MGDDRNETGENCIRDDNCIYPKKCSLQHEGQICLDCYCGESSKSCHFNSKGEKICECFSGFAQRGETCEVCNCGKDSYSCFFGKDGNKECKCHSGYAPTNGICKECECGIYGSCYFLELGNSLWNKQIEKRCICAPSTYEIYGKCIECDCGLHGLCVIESGQKKCLCGPPSIEKNGKCIVTETSTSISTDSSTFMTTVLTSTISECDCGPFGKCTFESGNKKCVCEMKTAEKDGKCVDCYCGENAKFCNFDEKGERKCSCSYGYAENNGYCDECNCGPYGSCRFEYGQKRCDCQTFASEKNGVCVVMEITSSEGPFNASSTVLTSTAQDCHCGSSSYSCYLDSKGYKICDCFFGYSQLGELCAECNCGPYGTCGFEYGQKKCHCRSFAVEMNGVCVEVETTSLEVSTESIEHSTVASSTVQECNCGPYGSCEFEYGQKKCHCKSFAIEKNGVCIVINTTSSEDTTIVTSTIHTSTIKDCNCGKNSISCFYTRDGTKICNCDFGYIQEKGHCIDICSEDKCVYGKCEVVGNSFKCRCTEGFTGRRCEDKVENKSDKQDLFLILQLSVAFAIFILLFGIFCFLIGKLNKRSK
ncbi:unnamed protein product [Larinioides sclopetarius]|uniref:EGF-like domain-containing protein n=1 Tax=Larinioides sclopetarius TaxID=280406 RepID=A0AAV2AWC0_9ARAC